MSGCWLCRYSSNECPYMKTILDFIRDSAFIMDEEEIITQVCDSIAAQWPDSQVSRAVIKEHIHSHMVCPNLFAAHSVRKMKTIADEIEGHIVTTEVEGYKTIDDKMARLYLAYIAQMNNILKGDQRRPYPRVQAVERGGDTPNQ
eukprot:12884-Hanusia_phi.AAC.1